MSNIVIVFHSGYGHTAKIAQAVAEGSGGTLLAIDAEGNLPAGGWELLAEAKAIVFGSPTYMGNVSGPFKTFMDASSKPWQEQKWKDKLAAGFTISGSPSGDKLNTCSP
jgi:multimeric flavodoxin WrbA